MCTVTIGRGDETLLVTMNRDELRSRAPESPPEHHPGWSGPRDGERGGTWFGVNRQGLVACLLNAYPLNNLEEPDPTLPGGPSRGQLIPRVLSQGKGSLAAAHRELASLDLEPFNPFMLVLAQAQGGCVLHWGLQPGLLRQDLTEPWSVVTSSAWRAGEVKLWRERAFQEWLEQGAPVVEGVPAYHLLQPEGQQAWAPLALRPLSATRSLTQVRLEDRGGVLRWWAVPPDSRPAGSLGDFPWLAPRKELELTLEPEGG